MAEWRLGSYQLQRKLGEGGMAQVYLARDVRLGRDVAVKVLDRKLAERPGFRERFMREARLAAALDHPNIVPLYDFGDEDALFLVMPYISGGSLQDLLPRAPLQVGEVVTYGSQIADALDYAHQRKVVHRDVKPANMLIHADGRVMLSDFGLAKIVSQTNTPNAPRNRPDAGTPEYMAPEQVVGSSDARSDIYGLGVVLYLLLTGRLPFTGASSQEVMRERLHGEPVPPRRYNPSIPSAMEAVVLRAMARHPEDRYQRASELGAALLGALIADHDASPHPPGSSPSRDNSRPTGPAPFTPQGGYSGGATPQWRQLSSAGSGLASAPFQDQTSAPPPGSWEGHGPTSSIVGLLPDLDAPFTTHGAPDQAGFPEGYYHPGEATQSGKWGSFATSHNTGGGPALGKPAPNSQMLRRETSAPPPQFQRPPGPSRPAFSRPGPSRPSFSRPDFSHPEFSQPRSVSSSRARMTMAPAAQPLVSEMADPRAALPGSRMTTPPYAPVQRERSSRLWVVIAILLIIMLFATIALLRYYQLVQAASPH